jgi:hypothetical protein
MMTCIIISATSSYVILDNVPLRLNTPSLTAYGVLYS